MVENTNIYYDNTKYPVNQRLIQVFDYLKISKKVFADQLEVDKSNLSTVLNGKREMPPEWVYKLSKIHPWVNIEWFVSGEGQMLKLQKVDNFLPNENEPLEASATKFSSNLRALMSYHGVDAQGLSPLIELSPEIITQYLDQQRGPSLAVLIRLRRLWELSIDALLFEDLSNPESMENNLKKGEGGVDAEKLDAIEKALEELKLKMEKMERENDERRRKEERKKIDKGK